MTEKNSNTTSRWLNKESRVFLSRDYLREGQSAEERIREIAEAAERYLKKPGFADEFERYLLNGWISLSSPVWANFGLSRGLPISCNGSYIPDSVDGILAKAAEVGMMTKNGAGVSGYFGDVRPRGAPISSGGKSFGSVHFMEIFDKVTTVISQSSVRRGSMAAYLPVEHPDIKEFLTIRDTESPIQKLSIGVCISDRWMEELLAGDREKKKIWAKIIEKRFADGYPYIFFTDNVNKLAPDVYKDKGLKIHASNLCTEIALHYNEFESFVCCLASLNVLYYDEWKDSNVVSAMIYFLDAVLEEYIQKTRDIPFMESARRFAINQRAIGLGVLGWHSYLQSKMIPFESMEAKLQNTLIHKDIWEKALAASKEMAEIYGEPPLLKGYGRRHATLMAIAPTTSSSFILGQVSQGVEPIAANIYTKDLAKGKFTWKNPFLQDVLKKYGKDDYDTWYDISLHAGSVQHLNFLTDSEKAVFKTFGEIPQIEIIIQAVQRQRYIDQAQSINLMIHPDAPVADVSNLMIQAWKLGLKTLYYQRSMNPSQELARELLSCKSCEA